MTSGRASSAGSPVPPRALVTRPEPEARRWADQLCAGGIEAEALPLIEIIPPVDSQPVRQAWALLGSYAAVMFVSAHAVEQFFEPKPHLPSVQSVSYTHLTLPTSDLAEHSVVAVALNKKTVIHKLDESD